MRRLMFHILLLALFLTACGAPAPTPLPTPPEPVLPETLTPIPPPTITASPVPPQPSATPFATPTEVPLPTLELPTLAPNVPALAVWDGIPTYLADSQPGYYFRVHYDPEVWALVSDQFGQPALGHRTIQYCAISPAAGRGLPPALQVDHDVMYADKLTLDVSKAYENGVLKLVAYQVSDGTIFTGFEVSFQTESEACNNDALAVLTTLESVPVSRATPPVTPGP
ncbi:MAG: hypothetical protein ACM3QS_18140 [Bacteroidota bacterium]